MSGKKGNDETGSSLSVPSRGEHSRSSSDRSHDSSERHSKGKIRPVSTSTPPATILIHPSDLTRKGWMVLKEKKRYFGLKGGDLYWWNEQPQEKFELTPSSVTNKTAGHIALGNTRLVVQDGATVNILTEAGDTASLKCTSNDEAADWAKVLSSESTAHSGKRSIKYGWVTYGEKKRILYLGQGKLDILDAHLSLRRVIPLEARSIRTEGEIGFEVSSSWSVYSFECGSEKERDAWVRKISLQIIRSNTRYEDQAWERKGYLALNDRKSCFFGLKAGKLYYYRSARKQQGTGKRFVLADCAVNLVETADDLFIEIALKGVKYSLRAHSKKELQEWFSALQSSQKGKTVAGAMGAVFGAPLSKITATPSLLRNGTPSVIADCMQYLDQPSSFAMEGLFHQTCDLQILGPWIDAFNAGAPPNFAGSTAPFPAVACLVKHFLKNLPDPLIPESLQDDVLTHRNDSIELRHVFARLSPDARSVLKPLFELLNNLAFESRLVSNSAVELAAVITPLVLWHKKSGEADPDEEDLFLLKAVMAVGTLITRYDDVFEDVQPEVLALKKEVGSDTFDQLLSQLAGASAVPAAATAKKPLPSLENWAKDLRGAPARPLLPEAFLQAAAEKDRSEGLDELDALESELQAEQHERHAAAEALGVVVVPVAPGENTAALRAARPTKKKKGVRITDDDAELTKQRVQNATLMRTLRSSRKSRLTPEELAALKAKLETQIGSATVLTSDEKEALKRRFATEPRRKKKGLPRTETAVTTAITTLDDLFDELQQEKEAAPRAMLKRIATSQRLIQARQSSNPKLQNLDIGKFLREEAGIKDEKAAGEYTATFERNGIDGSRLHLLTADYLAELGIPSQPDRLAIVDAAKRVAPRDNEQV